jgi:hypothetical protein
MAIKLTRVHCTIVRGDVILSLCRVRVSSTQRDLDFTSLGPRNLHKKPFISRKFSVTGACFAELRAVKTPLGARQAAQGPRSPGAGVHPRSRRAGMPLPGLEHSDERPPDARFPTLPDAHGRLAHLRAHAPRLNERREQSQQHHRVTVWCGQPGHRREFAPAVSASISVYGMMLPRPSDRSSHLREVGASNIQTVKFCRAGIVTEAVRTSTIASGARIHLYGSGIDRSAAESRLCRISGYTKLAFSTRTAVLFVGTLRRPVAELVGKKNEFG